MPIIVRLRGEAAESPVYELLLIFMPKHDLLLTITKCFFFCLNLTRARTRRIIYNLMAKKSEVAKSRNVKEKFTANINLVMRLYLVFVYFNIKLVQRGE